MSEVIYKKKNGETKYFATYQGAWNQCIRLNEKTHSGLWTFEADETGYWYCHFDADFDVCD